MCVRGRGIKYLQKILIDKLWKEHIPFKSKAQSYQQRSPEKLSEINADFYFFNANRGQTFI
jgi:hypothetical protein